MRQTLKAAVVAAPGRVEVTEAEVPQPGQGEVTAHTDGVALHAAATPSFPGGALFAVHDDKAVSAFDLRDVARVLQLPGGCVE